MNLRHFIRFVVLGFTLAALRAGAVIYNYPVSVSYSGSAWFQQSVSQTGVISPLQPDFISLGPDSQPLFDVTIGAGEIDITALRTFTVGPNGFMDFNWIFTLAPGSGVSFGSANLVSSSLFSIPPFTFPVDPPVDFDPTTQSISVGGFIADGVGTATVNAGGKAVIAFTTVPEPTTWALFSVGAGAMWMYRRRGRVQV